MPRVLRLVAVAWLVCGLAPGAVNARTAAPDEPQTLTRRYLPADRVTGRYQYVPFEVPPGAVRIHIEQQYDRAGGANAVDLGLLEPGSREFGTRALRGWSGGARSEIVLTPGSASPGYRPGPLPAGRWHVILGLYRVAEAGVEVTLRISIERTARVTDAKGRWFAGDLHVHTVHSDGYTEPDRVLRLAADAGLDFVAITDHNNTTHALALPPDPARKPLLIVGEEITTPGGHANAWGLAPGDWLDFRLSANDDRIAALAEDARSKGALFSINHPFDDCEGCDWRQPVPAYLSAVEVWNGADGPQPEAIKFWDGLLRAGRRVTGVASSDWHRPPARIGAPSVRVFAAALTEAHVLDAISAGAVVMMRDAASPPPIVRVVAGDRVAGVGETLSAERVAAVEVRTSVPDFTSPGLGPCPAQCTVELWWNGDKVDSAAAAPSVVFRRPAASGYLRIALMGGATTIALTNPIYVEVR
jgi:hypothetical protein